MFFFFFSAGLWKETRLCRQTEGQSGTAYGSHAAGRRKVNVPAWNKQLSRIVCWFLYYCLHLPNFFLAHTIRFACLKSTPKAWKWGAPKNLLYWKGGSHLPEMKATVHIFICYQSKCRLKCLKWDKVKSATSPEVHCWCDSSLLIGGGRGYQRHPGNAWP